MKLFGKQPGGFLSAVLTDSPGQSMDKFTGKNLNCEGFRGF